MRVGDRDRARSSRIFQRHPWTCDGCARERPAGSTAVVVGEGGKIAAKLCVFCVMDVAAQLETRIGDWARRELDEQGKASLIAGEDYDPFESAPTWEEVWAEWNLAAENEQRQRNATGTAAILR